MTGPSWSLGHGGTFRRSAIAIIAVLIVLLGPLTADAATATATTTTTAAEREHGAAAYPLLTGPQFLALFDNKALPDTTGPGGPPPAITGNGAADARIRSIAESRGYRRRPASTGYLAGIDGVSLHPTAAHALQQLKSAAAGSGISVRAVSGYRSPDTQRSAFMGRLGASPAQVAAGQADGAVHAVLEWVAAPGYSKHQTGYAVDLTQGGGNVNQFVSTAAFAWMSADNYRNARRFGFVPSYPFDGGAQGPSPEPWEYVYVGTQLSAPASPVGSFELAAAETYGKVRVGGWAVDPSDLAASIDVHAYVGGLAGTPGAVGTVLGPARGNRPDVAWSYPGAGATHGFDAIARSATLQGRVPVCLYAINIGEGSNTLLGCRDVTLAPGHPFGSLDRVDGSPRSLRIAGWAIDPDTSASIEVRTSVDGAFVGGVRANRPRPDVGRAHPAHGPNRGFDAAFAAAPGLRQVCVRAVNTPGTTGDNPRLGCRSVWVVDPDAAFRDLLSTDPFHPAIASMSGRGVVVGFADGTFRPMASVTRQAAVAYLHRLAGSPTVDAPSPFHDVGPAHPFADAITWAASVGVTDGFGDGTFRPTATVTRQGWLAMVWRLAGRPEPAPGTAGRFRDVGPSHPFADAISWAAGAGITTGYPDGTFRPAAVVTRQGAAVMVDRTGL